MSAQGYCHTPDELCDWITFLAKSLPTRSIGTFYLAFISSNAYPDRLCHGCLFSFKYAEPLDKLLQVAERR